MIEKESKPKDENLIHIGDKKIDKALWWHKYYLGGMWLAIAITLLVLYMSQ
ncbi:MAG: hypothetical protein J6N72_00620 [Psychrobacter sp.]|nr:hypothetical protein [Psychrobacter sp.]